MAYMQIILVFQTVTNDHEHGPEFFFGSSKKKNIIKIIFFSLINLNCLTLKTKNEL